ncbi:MAG: hypothetical protein OEW62_06675 [Candidatus Bathyarchaeota archaeon]|nr:hypothetical protein [Candidatus Bathyarchaeota archaeon]
MRKKNLMWISSMILLILSLLGGLTVNTIKVSSEETPAIYIVPAETWNTSLTPGTNYQISIRTNYTGDDIWSYQFELEYNPNVLHGGINNTDTWDGTGSKKDFWTTEKPILIDSEKVYVNETLQTRDTHYMIAYTEGCIWFYDAPGAGAEVKATYIYDGIVNGNLITTEENETATFDTKNFDNSLGRLGKTMAYFYYPPYPPDTASANGTGDDILAHVTFHVVGYGFSDITLSYIGQAKTKMTRYNATADEFEDIDTILQHGFFCNIPPSHDVAVTSLVVPATAAIEQPVPIDVTVINEGTYDENVNLTVYYDTTVIKSSTFTLEKGSSEPFSWSWDTSGLAPSPPSYTINATATVLVSAENPTGVDDEPGDNSATQSVTLSKVHDVAVTSLVVPATAAIEQPVPISVTVSNKGSYDESVTLTVKNDSALIGSTSFALAKGPTSKTSSFSWDTSGLLNNTSYDINATATIVATDVNSTDNTDTKSVTLFMLHDVAVTSLVVQTLGTVGHPVPINVTVSNVGSYDESVVSLTVYYDSTVINSTSFTLLKGPTSNTSSFSWNTSGIAPATYTINATATITVDNDLSDNNKTSTIDLIQIHNVAVVNIEVPRRGNVSDTVPINVTVKNVGSYTETFNVTTYYDDTAIVLPTGKNYTTVTDLACTENTTILFTWNTTGVDPGFYTITAAAGLSNTDTWTGDGANTTFTTSRKPVLEDSEKVYVDGTLMTKPDNYTITYVAGKIEFTTAPSGGAQIKVTYTSALVNETYISDNTETAPWDVLVTILGDVDGDGAVGTSDLIAFSDAYGSEPGDPNWNPYCDFSDEKIDASDLFDLSKNYGGSI